MQKTIIAPYHAIKYSRYSCDLTIIKIQLLHHVLQFDIQILLSVTVNNQKLMEGRTIPKYRDAIASKKEIDRHSLMVHGTHEKFMSYIEIKDAILKFLQRDTVKKAQNLGVLS